MGSFGTDPDGEAVRALWMPAVLEGLLQSRDGGLRDNVATYALPPLLQLDQGALQVLLRAILPQEGAVAAASNAQARTNLPAAACVGFRDHGYRSKAVWARPKGRAMPLVNCWLT